MVKKYGDLIAGSVIVIASIIIYLMTFTFKRLTVSKIGPAFVPQIMAISLGIVGLVVLINGVKQLKLVAENQVEKKQEGDNIRVKAVVASLIAMFIYILLLESVGFIIMSAVYLFAQFFILMHKDDRKFPRMIIASVSLSVIVYFLFVYAFQLRLPAGILG